jgi:hypothetical protein
MATSIRLRGGTTSQHSTFTGAAKEVTVDTDKNTIVVHDGSTAGGFPLVARDSSGNATFADGEKAVFGTGSDLQIFHNGSASYITDQGTGNLVLQASQALIVQNGAGTESLLTAYQDGAVNLYHNNTKRIETLNTGAKVTGDLTVEKTTGNTQIAVVSSDGIGSIEVGGQTNAFIDIKVPNSDDFDTRYSYNALNCAGDYVIQHTGATKLTTRGYGVEVTGELLVDSYNETYTAVTSSSNATTVNCEVANAFSHTLTENTTFTFSNPPTAGGTAYSFSIEIIQDASASGYTVTWPASVDWPSATAPTLTATASAKDVFVFYTRDGGTNWYGFTAGQALG